MTWTILVLVLAIALFLCGPMLLKHDAKKPSAGFIFGKKAMSLVAILLIAGCVCRLYTPYYLTHTNPEIIQEMITAMQEKQNAEKNKAVRSYVRSNAKEMMADAPILGNPDAEKTIFVWTDFSCPFCRRVHGPLSQVVGERDDVRVVVKNFSIHGPLSDSPAKAVIAAKLQDNAKAAALVELLMTRDYFANADRSDPAKTEESVKKSVLKIAAEAGLDTAKLERDMAGPVVAREMRNVRELAQRFEISGTPFLIIGEQAFPGAIGYDQIVEALK